MNDSLIDKRIDEIIKTKAATGFDFDDMECGGLDQDIYDLLQALEIKQLYIKKLEKQIAYSMELHQRVLASYERAVTQAKLLEEKLADARTVSLTDGQRIGKLNAKIKDALGIGEVHPSWGTCEEYNDGWHKCREEFRKILEKKC